MIEVFTDNQTLMNVSILLVGEPYDVVLTSDDVDILRYTRNGSVYHLTYVGPYLRRVSISPIKLLKDENESS